MTREFHLGNRKRLYERLKKNSVVVLFSGRLTRKTADEYYPFWADRNFVYLTGLKKEELVLVAEISDTDVKETLYLLPPDDRLEKWTAPVSNPGRQMKFLALPIASMLKRLKAICTGCSCPEITKTCTWISTASRLTNRTARRMACAKSTGCVPVFNDQKYHAGYSYPAFD